MNIERLNLAIAGLKSGLAPVPSNDLIYIGDGPYIDIAAEFLEYFVTIAKLPTDGVVLDIGSGIGRMASGLSLYLDPQNGKYVGFEPVAAGVDWCIKAYADSPNFQFNLINIYNELYNPGGTVKASAFNFPLGDRTADLVIATSIFTHLYEEDIAAYCREIGRVLKPSGRLFATAYVFEGDTPPNSERELVRFDQRVGDNPYRRHLADAPPLAAVCYQIDYLRELIEANSGRKVDLRMGRWQGHDGPWYQDLVLL